MNRIEATIGARLFERLRDGYQATLAGEEIAQAARHMAASAADAERRVEGRDLRPSGVVRLTTTDSLFEGLLSPVLAFFQEACPEIVLEVAISNDIADLSKRDAEIALRPSDTPPEHLVGYRLGAIRQAVYRLREAPDRRSAAPGWIGPGEGFRYRSLETWMRTAGHDRHCGLRLDSVLAMAAATEAGLGRAVLPCYLGDRGGGLVREGEPIPDLETPLWLLTHPDLKGVARIRAVTGFLRRTMRTMPRPALVSNAMRRS